MGDKDKSDEDGVNLEMPSLGLGGLRRRRKKAVAEEPGTAAEPREEGSVPAPEPPEPSVAPAPEPVAPELDAEPAQPAAEPDPTPDQPVAARTDSDPPTDADPSTILDEPAPTGPTDDSEDTAVLPTEEQRPLFADEAPARVDSGSERDVAGVGGDPGGDEAAAARGDGPGDDATDREGGLSLPAMPPMHAAMITGVIVGLLSVGAVYLGLRGCEAVQGTSSCGGPGLFLLIAIMIGLVFAGGFLLRAWHVSDPMSTSFLAVGLLAVIALLFLTDVIFSPWMLLVIPIVGIGTFALSHWVTVAFIEPAENDTELHDVE